MRARALSSQSSANAPWAMGLRPISPIRAEIARPTLRQVPGRILCRLQGNRLGRRPRLFDEPRGALAAHGIDQNDFPSCRFDDVATDNLFRAIVPALDEHCRAHPANKL